MTTRAAPTAREQVAELQREVADLRAAIGTMAIFVTPHAPIPWNVSPELDAIRREQARRLGDKETRPFTALGEQRVMVNS